MVHYTKAGHRFKNTRHESHLQCEAHVPLAGLRRCLNSGLLIDHFPAAGVERDPSSILKSEMMVLISLSTALPCGQVTAGFEGRHEAGWRCPYPAVVGLLCYVTM